MNDMADVAAEDLAALDDLVTKVIRDAWTPAQARALVSAATSRERRALLDGLWSHLAKTDVFALTLPTQAGGSGLPASVLAATFRELGSVVAPTLVRHTLNASVVIGLCGISDELIPDLSGVASGERRVTIINRHAARVWVTEPGRVLAAELDLVDHASDSDELMLPLPEDGGWVLIPVHEIEERFVPRSSMGYVPRERVELMDCRVPAHRFLTTGSQASNRRVNDILGLLVAEEMVGGSARVIADTVTYLSHRHQFGRPLASLQAVQHRLARLSAEHAAAVAAAAHSWRALDAGDVDEQAMALARGLAARLYTKTTQQAHVLWGGMGFALETDLHLWSERARSLAVEYGDFDHHIRGMSAGWLP